MLQIRLLYDKKCLYDSSNHSMIHLDTNVSVLIVKYILLISKKNGKNRQLTN